MKPSVLLLAIALLMPVSGYAADQDMPGHAAMNKEMQTMQQNMDTLKSQEHCMPNMTAHCQMIADLDYMQGRMADMKEKMQHCIKDEKDCPMPEMVGEMSAMNKKMDEMTKAMQGIAAKPKPNIQ